MSNPSLKTKEFLAQVAELARMQLPAALRDVQFAGPIGSLIKLHYGYPKVHFEVWVRRRTGHVEVGLHFEGAPRENAVYLEELTSRYSHVIASLGRGVEPEQWAGSWTRVHQEVPFSNLDEDLLMVVSGCLSQMIRTLEPIVREITPVDSRVIIGS